MILPGNANGSPSLRETITCRRLPSYPAVDGPCRHQFDAAKGIGPALWSIFDIIPNVIDFETPPPDSTNSPETFGSEIGLAEDDILVLQPTRLVARKGIEHAIELLRRLKEPRLKLVLSHPGGDEGDAYVKLLLERIADAGIEALDLSPIVSGSNEASPLMAGRFIRSLTFIHMPTWSPIRVTTRASETPFWKPSILESRSL